MPGPRPAGPGLAGSTPACPGAMAELTTQERLQPSLLDRVSDDEPEVTQESRERRVLSVQKLREVVLRDLAWLFNAVNLTAVADLDDHPEIPNSVLNYGLPDMAGRTVSGIDLIGLERLLWQAIVDFEPRIMQLGNASCRERVCQVR